MAETTAWRSHCQFITFITFLFTVSVIRQMAPLFSKVDSNKLWHAVQHEENVIYVQFGKDLFNISKVMVIKSGPVFWLTVYRPTILVFYADKTFELTPTRCIAHRLVRPERYGRRWRQSPKSQNKSPPTDWELSLTTFVQYNVDDLIHHLEASNIIMAVTWLHWASTHLRYWDGPLLYDTIR